MTTLQGFTDGSYDYKHMYNIKDLRGPLPIPVVHDNTLLSYLMSSPEFEPFLALVEKAGLSGKFNSIQADFTVFVPTQGVPTNVSSYEAKQIVLSHLLERTLSFGFLRSSRMMYLDTRIPSSRILVENFGPMPLLNRQSQVIGKKQVGHAIVFIIDRALTPCLSNPLINIDI